MDGSIRVSTIACLFAGLTVGMTAGVFSAAYVAKNWPIDDYVEAGWKHSFAAPSPMIFGQTASGRVALCDNQKNAWRLRSYEPEGPDHLVPAWTGVQDLTPIYRPNEPVSTPSVKESSSEDKIILPTSLLPAEHEKCV